jgi:hypothetical protein
VSGPRSFQTGAVGWYLLKLAAMGLAAALMPVRARAAATVPA